ncbi:hydroxymethylglutaryl-CoA lyase [Granulosicoccus sp. 3-233]|uniref:hydroxymethylglutaryl-CoA lyase n=1 Tax=Granulosicoccus sp. 3-233 TaxID=3417969 RepID=UPI003D34EB53
MSDLPASIRITEEGPREGFQIEPRPISTGNKVRFIQALAKTGVSTIQVCSFVSPRRVPGWADADEVVRALSPEAGVRYTALWFNAQGIDRAIAHRDTLSLIGTIHTVASEPFCQSNLRRSLAENRAAMHQQCAAHRRAGIRVSKISVMAAFGCNFAGDLTVDDALKAVDDGMQIAVDCGEHISEIALADTMGWANPLQIQRVVCEVRSRWPDPAIRLHLHDTRGLGIANAYAGLCCGVNRFDSTVGGLGGCPFAVSGASASASARQGMPPGNIASEELVLLAHECGVETGVDLEALIDAGHLAEELIGHGLPGAVLRGGSLARFRNAAIRGTSA